jgi:hypothetical protein
MLNAVAAAIVVVAEQIVCCCEWNFAESPGFVSFCVPFPSIPKKQGKVRPRSSCFLNRQGAPTMD